MTETQTTPEKAPDIHALLIGVDCYPPRRSGSLYPSLAGSVHDVLQVKSFLIDRLGVPAARIRTLTASNTGEGEPPEPPEPREDRPTYENMVAELARLRDTVPSGDQVYVHYSGHGGRTATSLPKAKGPKGLDECLVPYDIHRPGTRYLRDHELSRLLKAMKERGLLVTLVLDCCHSGGAARGRKKGARIAVRGVREVDPTERPTESLVAPADELAAAWLASSRRSDGDAPKVATRTMTLGSGWFLNPEGYVLLAACRPLESAYEAEFDDGQPGGALTYWMLDALRGGGMGLSYKQLHDRVLASVHSRFPRQTPQLEGDAGRLVLGREQIPVRYAVGVMAGEEAGGRVVLGAGRVHGLRRQARLAVYPAEAPLPEDPEPGDRRLAVVEITGVGAASSNAEVRERVKGTREVREGDQALLLDLGSVRLRRAVRLVPRPPAEQLPGEEESLRRLEQILPERGKGFLDLEAGADPEAEVLAVGIDDHGAYEIRDGAGDPLPNQAPPILLAGPDAAERMADRLVHVARFRNVQQLTDPSADSPLRHALQVDVGRLPGGYDPDDDERVRPVPFDEPGNTPELVTGEWVCLRIRNGSSQELNIGVLDLQPDWGISQIYPSVAGGVFHPLSPGREVLIPLQADLPPGCEEGVDLLKVFATLGPTNFRWLELPALGVRSARGTGFRHHPSRGLEALMATVAVHQPTTRHMSAARATGGEEWTVAQVELRIRRPVA